MKWEIFTTYLPLPSCCWCVVCNNEMRKFNKNCYVNLPHVIYLGIPNLHFFSHHISHPCHMTIQSKILRIWPCHMWWAPRVFPAILSEFVRPSEICRPSVWVCRSRFVVACFARVIDS